MVWPVDKLTLINQCLAITGNELVATPDDGSDEWNAASAGYDVGFEYALASANWAQCTRWVALTPTGETPVDNQFDAVYLKPQDCVHVILVRLADAPARWTIVGNNIYVARFGSASVKLKYVSSEGAADQLLRDFHTAIHKFVLAAIYRGKHEDAQQASIEEREAIRLLEQAKFHSDQEKPKRAMFNSRLSMARRIRRPWPVSPPGWGGTGTPGG